MQGGGQPTSAKDRARSRRTAADSRAAAPRPSRTGSTRCPPDGCTVTVIAGR